MKEIKRFSSLSDLDEKKQVEFSDFGNLNKILENLGNKKITLKLFMIHTIKYYQIFEGKI